MIGTNLRISLETIKIMKIAAINVQYVAEIYSNNPASLRR